MPDSTAPTPPAAPAYDAEALAEMIETLSDPQACAALLRDLEALLLGTTHASSAAAAARPGLATMPSPPSGPPLH